MNKTLFLNLAGHRNDKMDLQDMVEQAKGDIETFRDLYRKRFNFAARLITKDHPNAHEGELIAVN